MGFLGSPSPSGHVCGPGDAQRPSRFPVFFFPRILCQFVSPSSMYLFHFSPIMLTHTLYQAHDEV